MNSFWKVLVAITTLTMLAAAIVGVWAYGQWKFRQEFSDVRLQTRSAQAGDEQEVDDALAVIAEFQRTYPDAKGVERDAIERLKQDLEARKSILAERRELVDKAIGEAKRLLETDVDAALERLGGAEIVGQPNQEASLPDLLRSHPEYAAVRRAAALKKRKQVFDELLKEAQEAAEKDPSLALLKLQTAAKIGQADTKINAPDLLAGVQPPLEERMKALVERINPPVMRR